MIHCSGEPVAHQSINCRFLESPFGNEELANLPFDREETTLPKQARCNGLEYLIVGATGLSAGIAERAARRSFGRSRELPATRRFSNDSALSFAASYRTIRLPPWTAWMGGHSQRREWATGGRSRIIERSTSTPCAACWKPVTTVAKGLCTSAARVCCRHHFGTDEMNRCRRGIWTATPKPKWGRASGLDAIACTPRLWW